MKNKKGVTGSELKYIAILAMLIDHIAALFIPADEPLYACMKFVGRLTAPIMCFFISEGYHYTKNLKKYFVRLSIFAVISHFAFAFAFNGSFLDANRESMITTLFLCLLAVHVIHFDKIKLGFKLPLLLLIAYTAQNCDWGAEAVIYTIVFDLARENRKTQIIAYSGAAAVFKLLPLIKVVMRNPAFIATEGHVLGVFLTIPLLLLYNGEKGGGKYTKWVFYVFYPLHLLLLGYIGWKYS